MEYTKKEVKLNLIIMLITNLLAGFHLGLRDLTTTMQILFSKVGGEQLLILINQMTYYTLIICVLLITINVQKIDLKYKIIFLDTITYIGYLAIGILLVMDKLTSGILFGIMLVNMICNRLLAVLSMDFKMKIIPKNNFKRFLSDITFIQILATAIGICVAYFIVRKPYPDSFATLMFISFFIGIIINIISAFMVEKTKPHKKHDIADRINIKDIIKVAKEKNFIYLNIGRLILNMSYGIIILYAMYAMRLGYKATDIVIFGIVQFGVRAMCSIFVPKLKISSRQIMMIGHLLIGLTAFLTYITHNFYVGFAMYGAAEALLNLGYFSYINSLGDERKHIYLTAQTFFIVSIGFSIPFAAFVLNTYDFEAISILSLLFALGSIAFIEYLEETEETPIHIFSHFKRNFHI